MLEKIKKSSETFIVRFILFVIGCSFVFFGFSNQFSGNSNTALIVGDRKVSINELDEELRRQVAQMQQLMGISNFNYKQALQMGLLEQIIDNMAYRISLDIEAKENGILVSDDKIYEIIQNTKEFQKQNL